MLGSWTKPSQVEPSNGDGFRSPGAEEANERKTNIRLAWFFSVAALLFVLADFAGRTRKASDARFGPDSTELVNLNLSPVRSVAGLSVWFRLSNRGNHSIFYPADRTTGIPVGQILFRPSTPSEWRRLAAFPGARSFEEVEVADSNVVWLEMPPGGWVEGEFQDSDQSGAEHAYAIYVKLGRDAKGVRILSKSYSTNTH
jgi:hypothetical protein